jgi:hypothetical protein
MSSLLPAQELQGYTLLAVDGEIGEPKDFYFDEVTWAIRYLVVNTGAWLKGRHVLISPFAIGEVKQDEKLVHVELTREQIKNSPPIDTHTPVSRQYEEEYFKYFAWPTYWDTRPLSEYQPPYWQLAPLTIQRGTTIPKSRKAHLRSTGEVGGYGVKAQNGAIGQVTDFLLDIEYWIIRYLQVDAGNWLPGKQVLINPSWIMQANWMQRVISFDLKREAIKSAPGFDPSKKISRDYEVELFRHYDHQAYWQQGVVR